MLKWKGFATDEINNMYDNFEKNGTGYGSCNKWLLRKESTDREKEYGNICYAFGCLNYIDDILNCSSQNGNIAVSGFVFICRIIGLFSGNGRNAKDKYARTSFTDEAKIAQYFDGYKNNNKLWEYIRDHSVDTRTFYTIIRGNIRTF